MVEKRILMPDTKATAVHDLICNMLRGSHVRTMPGTDLATYAYKAGVALHNLPFVLTGEQPLREAQLREINQLDPNAASGTWGPWASNLAAAFGVALPVVIWQAGSALSSPSTEERTAKT